MPFPFGKRDFVITRWDCQDSHNNHISLIYSISRQDFPQKKCIRGIFDTSGIILEQDENDPQLVCVQWIQQLDIRSSAPKWLLGSFWKEYYSALARLQLMLEGRVLKKERKTFVKISPEDVFSSTQL
jgi:hypothetical protein